MIVCVDLSPRYIVWEGLNHFQIRYHTADKLVHCWRWGSLFYLPGNTIAHCRRTCLSLEMNTFCDTWRERRVRFVLERNILALETKYWKRAFNYAVAHKWQLEIMWLLLSLLSRPTDRAWKVFWPEQHQIKLVWPKCVVYTYRIVGLFHLAKPFFILQASITKNI